MAARAKAVTRKRAKPARQSDIIEVKRGANREIEWTPKPPDELAHYSRYVEAGGSDILVHISEATPDGRQLYFCSYAGDSFIEANVTPEHVAQLADILRAAVEEAQDLGIVPKLRADSESLKLRRAPFAYTGKRGAAGE